ncbi:hypothetical protein Tco_0686324 [Tanacetum coccineum]
MGSHKLQQLKRYSFDELNELFETTMKNVNTFVPIENEDRGRALKLAAGSSQATITDFAEVGSSKRAAEAELNHEGSKRQNTNEASGSVQEQPDEEEKELSQEDLHQMMMVVPVEEVYVESLQVKYQIIGWEVYTEESRKYWKIIRVGNHTEAYQFFEDELKIFDRDDLVMIWNLVKERFSSTEPIDDKERILWGELKRVHHVSTKRGIDIFMLVEKEYLLSKGVLTLMLVNRLINHSLGSTGSLPPNSTLLSHHAQPFIPSSLHMPTGLVPIHVNPYSQPSMGLVNGQTRNFPFQNQIVTPSSNYPFYTQPMYAPPNMPMYPNPIGSFTDSTGSVIPFVRWIEDYPLPDGLKMPSHIGSYDGKGDPDNFLHLFEGAIHMQKCRQNKFTKTHLAVHNIKQRKGESTRAFITRYTDDTLQILGLHEEQRVSSFVHGLWMRNLVEHLSTYLPCTYKGLMEKTYTWIEAREVATNRTPNDRRENFKRSRKSFWDNNRGQKGRDRFSLYQGPNHGLLSNLSKSPREILVTEKVNISGPSGELDGTPTLSDEEEIRSLETRSRDVSKRKKDFRERKKFEKIRAKMTDFQQGMEQVLIGRKSNGNWRLVPAVLDIKGTLRPIRWPLGIGWISTLGGSGGESFWEGGDDFRVDVLRFHTCLTDILGFLEKLEWWFEQDIDDEEEEDDGGEGGSEV